MQSDIVFLNLAFLYRDFGDDRSIAYIRDAEFVFTWVEVR